MKTEPQLSAEEVIKKDFPDLAEGMAAHCITTTVPDEPNGQPLELWVMPIGQVMSWMRIANKQAIATALEEQRAEYVERVGKLYQPKINRDLDGYRPEDAYDKAIDDVLALLTQQEDK